MDFSSATSGGGGSGGKSYNHQHLSSHSSSHHHHAHHTAHHLHHSGGHVSPPSQLAQLSSVGSTASLIKAEEATAGNMATTASPALTGFGVSAAGVNLSVNIGVNITGVTPESAAAPWATAAAYTSRYE